MISAPQSHAELPPQDEGGLRPPPGLSFWRRIWWWFDFLILVKLARLRFVAILVVIGLLITKWDLLVAYHDKWTRRTTAMAAAGSGYEWFCPMHPSVVRDNPKDKCPICFMPLSKRKKGEGSEAEPLPAGIVSRVQLSPYRVVLAGVGTWRVDSVPLSREIIASGLVEFNERAQKTVSARVAGRIDKLLVSETGQIVDQGDVLAEIYSPDLFVTVQNLLHAQKAGNESLVRDARSRLELLGIDTAQIQQIVEDGQPNTSVKIRSPISGHVIQKYVREGQYIEEGMPLYEIVDLSTVWIQAQIYEDDIALLPVAQDHPHTADVERTTVVATTRAFPNEEFRGTLKFIYPHVDQSTRTLTVRFEVENPEHKLRPGSTATVRLFIAPEQVQSLSTVGMSDLQRDDLAKGKVLAVPTSSVIDTGDQKIVYRQASPGEFEGVRVTVGPRMVDPDGVLFLPVLSGLAAGDQIVTSGSFLVDAETRLNPAAGSIYFGGSSGAKSSTASTTVRATTPDDPDAKVIAELAKLPAADRELAEKQRTCPILANSRIGSMGSPVKLTLDGETVFLCCQGCTAQAKADPEKTAKRVKELRSQPVKAPRSKEAPPSPKEDLLAAVPAPDGDEETEIAEALAKLPPDDRKLAIAQQFCVVSDKSRLGSMGTPVKLMVNGEPVFLCCDGCEQAVKDDPQSANRKVKELRSRSTTSSFTNDLAQLPGEPVLIGDSPPPSDAEQKIAADIAKLPPADRDLALSQKYCAVLTQSRLGSMGKPVKVMLKGEPVFLCCAGCEGAAKKDPQGTLTRTKQLREANQKKSPATANQGGRR